MRRAHLAGEVERLRPFVGRSEKAHAIIDAIVAELERPIVERRQDGFDAPFVRGLAAARSISNRDIAKALELSEGWVARVLLGHVPAPEDFVSGLAVLLGVDRDVFRRVVGETTADLARRFARVLGKVPS